MGRALGLLTILLPAARAGECGGQCTSLTQPWPQKCAWTSCGACPECPPAAPPAAPGTPPCASFCKWHTKPWSQKCHFPRCAGCTACLPEPCPSEACDYSSEFWDGSACRPYSSFAHPSAPPSKPPLDLSPTLCAVGGVTTRTRYAEPWRTSSLSATDCNSPEPLTVDWVIEFQPYEGRLHSIPPRMTESERYTTYTGAASKIDHTFSYPGDYFVCVRESGAAAEYGSGAAAEDGACTTIRNRYVHRELSLVTDEEWSAFAYAMNVVKSTSTSEGRAQFGPNCLQSDNEFYTHDAFVALHYTLAGNFSGDQLHYLELQEPAHQAWTSKLQQALRCVDRSVSHIWSDFTHDYDHTDGTDKGMVGTRVFSADRYGSAMNYDIPGDDPAHVTDGSFANWTVTQTDDLAYLCGDLKEMVSEETMLRCIELIQNNRGVGYSAYQPRPQEQLEFVSRRPFYMLAKNSNICATSTSTFASLRNAMTDPSLNLTHVQSMTLASALHGVAHDCASGKWWSPTSPVPGFTAAFLQALGAGSSEELMSSSSFLVSVMRVVLGNDRTNNVAIDLNNEVLCHDDYCECQPYFNPFYIANPDLDLDMLLNEYPNSLVGSTWARHIRSRGPLYLNGCNWPRSGTYDWSASANQDPLFYAFHWHTFAWVYLGAQTVTAKTGVTFIEQARDLLKTESPGGRFDDITRFKDLVPYREGQVEGSFHTWEDILTHFFSFEESVFEYPEYKTSYDDPAYRAGIHAAQCLQDCATLDLGLVYEVLYQTLAALPAGTLFAIPNLPCPTFIGMFKSSLSTSSTFAPCYAT